MLGSYMYSQKWLTPLHGVKCGFLGLQEFRLYSGHFPEFFSVGLRALHLTPANGNHLDTRFTVGDHHPEFVLSSGQEVVGLCITQGDHFGQDNVTWAETLINLNLVFFSSSDIFLAIKKN